MAAKELLKQLPDNWQEKILDLYSEGMSDYEVMTELGIHWSTFKRFMADAEFAEVVEFGRQCSRAWWEKQGRVHLMNKDFNANLWKTNVQNRIGWSDKTSTHDSTEGFERSLTEEQLDQELERRLKRTKISVVDKSNAA